MSNTLYDLDLQLWIEQTIQQLSDRDFGSLDIEHLIEELVDLGKAEKNALRSNLTILLAHLLKLAVQHDAPDMMKASWYSSILEHRQRSIDNLADTLSLKSFLVETMEKTIQMPESWRSKRGSWLNLGFAYQRRVSIL